jgi:hypothetical protein
MRPLTDDEKGWSYAQAELRHTLKIMKTERYREYQRQWIAIHGEPVQQTRVLAIKKIYQVHGCKNRKI